MNNLTIFESSEFGSIRTVELDGEPWLVGKDVATALGYKNPQEAIRTHVDDEDKGVSEILTPGGKQSVPIISVMDIYSDKKSEVNEAITEYLNEKLQDEYGINIASALVIDVELDNTLMQKVQAKEQAKQDAEIAELEKQTAMAQAETDKVKAQAKADVDLIEAQAEADAAKIAADAEAEANSKIAQSITPELIQWQEAQARMEHGWVTVQGADTVVTKP